MRDPLETEIQYVKGVGPKLAELLGKLGLKTVRDVLHYYPRRYEDRSHLPPISTLRPGVWATVRGRITHVDSRPISGGRVVIKAMLSDGKSGLALVWFNQPWVKRKLERYRGELIAYGHVKEGSTWLEMASPEYELLDEEDDPGEFARIVPVYGLSEGIHQSVVRRAVDSALTTYLGQVPEPLPDSLRKRYGLIGIQEALLSIHRPESEEARLAARKRLAFEELFYAQVALAIKRVAAQAEPGIRFPIDRSRLRSDMAQMFPFTLTRAQDRVIEEIWMDMESDTPMNRLVQGDVGSGKTAVAACAILAVVRAGYQAAMMAPTEILAEQHHTNLSRLFEPLQIPVTLLVGKLTPTQRERAYRDAASGTASVLVGTHALIQEGVAFHRLGLAVIDEQHRFGVLQRAALRQKGLGNPDVLVMTATPIPRTLTMSIYGDLRSSVIDELPPGRQPIKTYWKSARDRAEVYRAVRDLLAEGRQAYVVCPMVAESEKMTAQAAEEIHHRLANSVYPDLRVGLLHGQLKTKDKEAVMERFRAHELDVLVATTVVEVGVDVPNATIMVIEDANRFGLSQLHQLRGRVGRGSHQSFCILIADAKTEDAQARMEILSRTNDGFKIAEEDLRLRGPGEVAGTRQSGNLDFKLADLVQDLQLVEQARDAAQKLIEFDPGLERPQYALIRRYSAARLERITAIEAA